MIHRTIHDGNYDCISNKIGRNKDLSFKAKGILLYMLGCKDDWDFSVQGICTMSNDGYAAVKTGLIELEKAGYLKRTTIRDKGKIADVKWDVYEEPQGIDFYDSRITKK